MEHDVWLAADTAGFRRRWLEPLASWLCTEWLITEDVVRLLDYGCGDLQLASLLPATVAVDGYDVSAAARGAARHQLSRLGRSGQVVDSVSELPSRAYGGIVLSSMVQYLAGIEALDGVLRRMAELLAPDGLGIVITDVVPETRSRRRDAADTWRVLRRDTGRCRSMVRLARKVRRSPGRLTHYSRHDIETSAAQAGFDVQPIVPNLSPFQGRTSYVLRPVDQPFGAGT